MGPVGANPAGVNPAAGNQTGGTSTGASGAGNAGLNEAFDEAITQAQQTLEITTKRGADLYALKQRAQ